LFAGRRGDIIDEGYEKSMLERKKINGKISITGAKTVSWLKEFFVSFLLKTYNLCCKA